MSTLKEQLSQKMKESMKARDQETLAFVRNLHSAIRKKEIDTRVDLNDDDVQKIVLTLVKQRKESIDQFEKGNRPDLVEKEKKELAFLETYLPPAMSEAELMGIIAEAINLVQPQGPKDMGKVMKEVMAKTQGRADGKLVQQKVRERIGS